MLNSYGQWKAGILWAVSLGLLSVVIFLENIIARDVYGDMIPELGLIHSTLEHVFKLLTGVLVFSLLDKVLLPNLDINKALVEKDLGATLIWGLIFSVILYSFTVVI